MERLSSASGLVVSQKKEWGEIVSGFETQNKYVILDTQGNELYMALEDGGSVLARWFLKALRPFEINIIERDGRPILRVNRPFRFYFHELEVFNPQGRLVGGIKRRFSVVRRIYSVMDSIGQEIFTLFGPILHPWTFEIKKNEMTFGKITKKWSGLMKEGFTDADNFAVTFPAEWDTDLKSLFLGAVFLIDFVHFEDKSGK